MLRYMYMRMHEQGRGRLLNKRSVLRGRGGRVAHEAAVCASAVSLSSPYLSMTREGSPSELCVRTLRVMTTVGGGF